MGAVEAGDMSDVLTLAYFGVAFAFITTPMLYLTWHGHDTDGDAPAVES